MLGFKRPAVFALFLLASTAAVAQIREGEKENEEKPLAREELYRSMRTYPFGAIPRNARLAALREMDRLPVTRTFAGSALQWTLAGPQPINIPYYPTSAGRVTALAVDPRNADVAYAGAAEGGVWKTVDGGQNWTPLTDDQPALAIGSLALDPSAPNTVYAGTGEANSNGDGYSGAGILKSTDGGRTWLNIPGPFAGNSIGALAVHPQNSQIVLAAAGDGIFRSSDSGNTWQNVLPATVGSAVLFDPANPQDVYAGLGYLYGGTPAGVFKSTDAGITWKPLGGTAPNTLPAANIGRVSLAISVGTPATLIAGIEKANDDGPALVFRSTDGGLNWQSTTGQTYCQTACFYNNAVGFNPANPKVLLAGGTNLMTSFDGGSTWQNAAYLPNGSAVHPDIHAIAFSSDGARAYVGSDGGVWRADDLSSKGATWTPLNQTLAITQFYPGLSLHPSDPNIMLGGTQDNGALVSSGALAWNYAACGDGWSTAIDPVTPTTVYVLCGGNAIQKSTSAGAFGSFHSANSGIPSSEGLGSALRGIALDPSQPSNLYYGEFQYIFQSTDGAASWKAISPNLTGGNDSIFAITVAPGNSGVVYAGTFGGQFWTTSNATAGTASVWSNRSTGLPQRSITSIAVDAKSPTTVYVSLYGFQSGHVFKTADGGKSWSDVSGNLPDIPANAVVIDPDLANTLYLATDIGVFWTTDGGHTWAALGQGLPRVAVRDLAMHQPTRTLRAATHGRSMWSLGMPLSGLNPAPSATALLPAAVTAGSGSVTVSVSGANFTPASTVSFGTLTLAASFVSPTQLNVGIPASALTVVAQVDVEVITAPPGGGASNALVFTVAAPPAAGRWRDAKNEIVNITQAGNSVVIQYPDGSSLSGTASGLSTLQVSFSAGCCTGALRPDGSRIDWSDGTSWYRPYLGQWAGTGLAGISQSGATIVVRLDDGRIANGTADSNSNLNINFGGGCCTGVLSAQGNQIAWSNATAWTFAPLSTTTAGTVNAASFLGGPIAAGELLSLFGSGFSSLTASSSATPLSASLLAVSASFTDSAGITAQAGMEYVSPTLVNCVAPTGLATGPVTLAVTDVVGQTAQATVTLADVAPGIFTANANGKGVPAATAVRYGSDGSQTPMPVYQCSATGCVPAALDLGQAGDQTYLTLYATGVRGRASLADVKAQIGGVPAQVLYAGPQGAYSGLDQINIVVPQSLQGAGQADLVLSVANVEANTVTVAIK